MYAEREMNVTSCSGALNRISTRFEAFGHKLGTAVMAARLHLK